MRRAKHLAKLSSKKAVDFSFLSTNNKPFLEFKANTTSGITNSSLVHQQHPPTNKLVREFQQRLYHSSLSALNKDEKVTSSGVDVATSLSAGEEVVGASTTPTITLDATKFEEWTKEQVCSLLIRPEVQGGVPLSEERVKPLYDAKFDGTLIGNIIETINRHGVDAAIKNKIKKVPRTTWEAVVQWVDKLLKTRLYHLWNDEQVIELLCKPIEKGGADLSVDDAKGFVKRKLLTKLLSILERTHEERKVVDEFNKLMKDEQINNSNLIECMKNIINSSLLRVNDTTFSPPQFNDLPYQNNKSTIQMMATTLLENTTRHQSGQHVRYQTLLINSGYVGSGKTRLGVEFLSQFKLLMIDNPEWRIELEKKYSPSVVQQLAESNVVYVDCRKVKIINNDLRQTFNSLKKDISEYLDSSIESTPCFVILDEIGSLVTKYQPIPIEGVHKYFSSMNEILRDIVLPFQEIPTVSLYVCGKGAFMDIVDSGRLSLQSLLPTLFSKEDIQTTMNKSKGTMESLVTHLKQCEFFDYFVEKIYEETRGVPYFVAHYVLQKEFKKCQTREEINAQILETRSKLPLSFSRPYNQFSNQPMLMEMYHTLLFAGIVGMEIDITSRINISSFFKLDTKGTEFEGIATVNMLDIGSILNCYLHPVGKKVKLLFPQAIIQNYLVNYVSSKPKYNISWFAQDCSTGDTLEHLTRTLLQFKMAWGAAKNSKIGEMFPFLNKTSIADIYCYPLEIVHLANKFSKDPKENKKAWKETVNELKGTRKLGYFSSGSHSPCGIWNVPNASTETYIEIQDNDLTTTTFNLQEEIEKNEKVRSVVGNKTKLIMLFMSRSGHSLAGIYEGGTTVDGIQLHKNTTVVILSKEEAIQFYGDSNIEALRLLSVSHK